MVELGWLGILQIFGALALLIYGMKVMSEGVQRIASIQLRDGLQRVTSSKTSSFLTGFFTTAAIQSSSATTVMTVSFVNAGIISLMAAAGIIIGANLGTTVTVWFVTILGFELNLFTLCLPLIGLSLPFIYIRNGKYRHWAETFIGFSLLLIALQFMKSVVPELQQQNQIMESLGSLGRQGILSVILYVVVGMLFTALIQSSAAALALTMTMTLNGWIPFDIAAAMVLGENIGTTFSTEIASWVGNIESKKAARFHVLFNVIGVLAFLPLLPLALPVSVWITQHWLDVGNPFNDYRATPVGLAVFYTIFNVLCAVVFLPSMPWLMRISERTLRKSMARHAFANFIDTGANSADLSVPVVLREIIQQATRLKSLNAILKQLIHYSSESEFLEQSRAAAIQLATIQTHQKATNQFLIGLVEDKSSLVTSRQIKSMLNISLLFDQVRSRYEHIILLLGEKKQNRIWFGPTQRSVMLYRIHDAENLLKKVMQLLQSNSFHKGTWKGLPLDLSDRSQDYLDYEQELLRELNQDELQLGSVLIYYRMAQHMDGLIENLRTILEEFVDDTTVNRINPLAAETV